MDLRSFFGDLKRRHVPRVAWMYAVAAFVVLQAAELLFPALLLPEYAFRLLVIVALCGFPVAMVVAWAYDITPEGVKRTPSAEDGPAAPATPVPAGRFDHRKLAYVGVGILVALVGFGLGAPYLRTMGQLGGSPLAVEDLNRSIVVLPFTSLSTEEEDRLFADGLTEDILSALSNTPGLHVVSRTTALGYRNTTKSIRQIGRELGVGTALEGSVRRDGDLARITVQLVDTRSDENLWAVTYDREVTEGFRVQTEVAQQIAAALQARLSPEEQLAAERRLEAYYYSEKGREYLARGGHQHTDAAVTLFEQALEIDSSSAAALSGLGEAYLERAATTDARWLDSAETRVRAALENGAGVAAAHGAMGRLLLTRGRPAEAVSAFEEAVRLDGADPAHHLGLARARQAIGRLDLALEAAARAATLAPGDGRYAAALAEIALATGDTARARREAESALAAGRPAPLARRTLALIESQSGNPDAARRHVERLAEDAGHDLTSLRAAGELELLLSQEMLAGAHLEAVVDAMANGIERPTTALALVYLRRGDARAAAAMADESIRRLEERTRAGDVSGETRYELARAYAVRGDADAAIAHLQSAAERGFRSAVPPVVDPAFRSLRGDGRFRAITVQIAPPAPGSAPPAPGKK